METYLRIDINLYAAVLLGFIIIHAFLTIDFKSVFNKVFLAGAGIMTFGLLVEALTCVLNSTRNPELRIWSTVMHIFLFVAAPVFTFVWYRLIVHMVGENRKGIRWHHVLVALPMLVQVIAILTTPWTRIFFHVDQNNVYHRGDLFLMFAGLTYFYVALGMVYVHISRRRIVKDEYLLFVLVSVAILLGGAVQSVFYGPLTMWSGGALGVVLVYFLIQDRMIRVDKLTGAWTRESFERHMRRLLDQNPSAVIGAFYLDVNGLKRINDMHGHQTGDNVLKSLVTCVREAVDVPHVLARMGGDEFIVTLETDQVLTLQAYRDRIVDLVRDASGGFEGNGWSVAIGHGVFHGGKTAFDSFVHDIDKKMYTDKRTDNGHL
jgi:diguanylate cyclase (GGDEF)-like protein